MSKPNKRRSNPPARVLPPGWSTCDTDEIERRRMRGVNEEIRVESQTPDDEFFGIYRIQSITASLSTVISSRPVKNAD